MASILYTDFSAAKTQVEAMLTDLGVAFNWTSNVSGVASGSSIKAASINELHQKVEENETIAAAGAGCVTNKAHFEGYNSGYYSGYYGTYNTPNYSGKRGGQRGYDTYRSYNDGNY